MFEFAWPWLFAGLPLPWLMSHLLPPAPQGGAALRLPHAHLFDNANATATRTRRALLLVLPWLAWALVVAASARPQWIGEPVDQPRSGRDLLLAVDVSGSMSIPDMELGGREATRFQAVQAILGDFIARRAGDRLGLVLFGSRAYLLTPLTFDTKTVRTQLQEAAVGLAGRETAIGDAIGLSVKRLRDRPAEQRVLVLLTDGVNTAGELEPRKAAELAKSNDLRIYTIGIGAERMKVQDFFGSRTVNPSAELDAALLTQIAQSTGGKFFRARDTRELAGIYAEIDKLEPAAAQGERYRPVEEWFWWPLGAALLLALLAAFVTTSTLASRSASTQKPAQTAARTRARTSEAAS
jgi:Ca-activated chloride channel family protein